MHADAAQVNVNLWITADEANLDDEEAEQAVYHDSGLSTEDFPMASPEDDQGDAEQVHKQCCCCL